MEDRGQYIKLMKTFLCFWKNSPIQIFIHVFKVRCLVLFKNAKGRQKSIVLTIDFPIKNIFIFFKTASNSDIFYPAWTRNEAKSQDSKFEERFSSKNNLSSIEFNRQLPSIWNYDGTFLIVLNTIYLSNDCLDQLKLCDNHLLDWFLWQLVSKASIAKNTSIHTVNKLWV